MGTFFGIEIGRRGIIAQQRALETTGHNVSNSNTKGYSRQEVVLSTTSPFSYPGMGAGQRGTGVQAQGVRRLRDDFLDHQYRNELKALGRWEVRQNVLEKLEAIFNEPGDQGLASLIGRFFDAWQSVARNPEMEGTRSALRQEGMALADAFRHLATQINDLKEDTYSSIEVKINEINSLADQIRDLNGQIVSAESGNMSANDLRDRRDLLLDQMAEIVPIQVEEDRFGAVTIVVRDHTLLTGQKTNRLASSSGGVVTWPDGSNYNIGANPAGSLEGLLEAVRQGGPYPGLIEGYEQRLNTLAESLVTQVNQVHENGLGLHGETNNSFFSGTSAGTITVNQDLMGSEGLSKIAAASKGAQYDPNDPVPPAAGDGSNALFIAQLRHHGMILDNETPGQGSTGPTFGDYYSGLIAELGVQGQEAERMVDNQEVLVLEIDNRRQAISGVSLDEEMVNMIRFQQAYNASARLISAVDEMLEVLINRTGLVGR